MFRSKLIVLVKSLAIIRFKLPVFVFAKIAVHLDCLYDFGARLVMCIDSNPRKICVKAIKHGNDQLFHETRNSSYNDTLFEAAGYYGSYHFITVLTETELMPPNRVFSGACKSGKLDMAKFALERGASNMQDGILLCVHFRQNALAHYLISRSEPNFKRILEYACSVDNLEILTKYFSRIRDHKNLVSFTTKSVHCRKFLAQKGFMSTEQLFVIICGQGLVGRVAEQIERCKLYLRSGLRSACNHRQLGVVLELKKKIGGVCGSTSCTGTCFIENTL